MKKLLTVFVVFALLFSTNAFSQSKSSKSKNFSSYATGYDYTTAIGFKFYPGAITVKHFVNNKAALEGLLYFWNYGSRITGLYEFYGPIKGAPGLKWYVGPGAHIGFWNNRWREYQGNYYVVNEYHGSYFGLDGVLGLDYKFKAAPINISLDWQPSFNLGSGPADYYGFYSRFGGLGIRYAF